MLIGPMNMLIDKKLINCVGELVSATRPFKKKQVVAYYFSASWCVPCKELLPMLKYVYKETSRRPDGFEIIYISSDTDEETMLTYFKEKQGIGWHALPFNEPAAEELRHIFDITHIPQIIVTRTSDGSIITKQGRRDIEELGVNVVVKWNTSQFA